VARHQGRQAASAARHSLLVGGCLGALGKTAPFEIPNAKGCATQFKSLPHPPHPENRRDAAPKGVFRMRRGHPPNLEHPIILAPDVVQIRLSLERRLHHYGPHFRITTKRVFSRAEYF
jgi:hypothetical protein